VIAGFEAPAETSQRHDAIVEPLLVAPPMPPRRRLTKAGAALAAVVLCAAAGAAPSQPAHDRTHRRPQHAAHRHPPIAPAYGHRADVQRFAADVAARRGLPREWLAMELAQARRVDKVRKLILPAPAGVPKNWAEYRRRFVEPQRIAAGVAFWLDNRKWLAAAEQRYGVAPEIVVGLIGVETYYGRLTGRFRTLDALATLGFDFPAGTTDRSRFFRGELEEFLVFCAREGIDPQKPLGSFAGAIGPAQFMPGSIHRNAVDLDGDTRVDLVGNVADAIGSVANYLAAAGWRPGEPTHFSVQPPPVGVQRAQLLAPDVKPTFSAAQMTALGATLEPAGRSYPGPLALVELENGGAAPSFVAGTPNFYAITRYNRSSYYAMAVIELALAIRQDLPAK
jgi:peptidoglycan lytic transglycosylase B